jgi:hypothetical protein
MKAEHSHLESSLFLSEASSLIPVEGAKRKKTHEVYGFFY